MKSVCKIRVWGMHHGGGGGGNQGGTQPCLWELEEEKRQQLYVQYYEVSFSSVLWGVIFQQSIARCTQVGNLLYGPDCNKAVSVIDNVNFYHPFPKIGCSFTRGWWPRLWAMLERKLSFFEMSLTQSGSNTCIFSLYWCHWTLIEIDQYQEGEFQANIMFRFCALPGSQLPSAPGGIHPILPTDTTVLHPSIDCIFNIAWQSIFHVWRTWKMCYAN